MKKQTKHQSLLTEFEGYFTSGLSVAALSSLSSSLSNLLVSSVKSRRKFTQTLASVKTTLENYFKRLNSEAFSYTYLDTQYHLQDICEFQTELQIALATTFSSFHARIKDEDRRVFLKWLLDSFVNPKSKKAPMKKKRKTEEEKSEDFCVEFSEVFLTTVLKLCKPIKDVEIVLGEGGENLPHSSISRSENLTFVNVLEMVVIMDSQSLLDDLIFHYPRLLATFACSRLLSKVEAVWNSVGDVRKVAQLIKIKAEVIIIEEGIRVHPEVVLDVLGKFFVENVIKAVDWKPVNDMCLVFVSVLVWKVDGLLKLFQHFIFASYKEITNALPTEVPFIDDALFAEIVTMKIDELGMERALEFILEKMGNDKKALIIEKLQHDLFGVTNFKMMKENGSILPEEISKKFGGAQFLFQFNSQKLFFLIDIAFYAKESVSAMNSWCCFMLLEMVGVVNGNEFCIELLLAILSRVDFKGKNDCIERFSELFITFDNLSPKDMVEKFMSEAFIDISAGVLSNISHWLLYYNKYSPEKLLNPDVFTQFFDNWRFSYSFLYSLEFSDSCVLLELICKILEFGNNKPGFGIFYKGEKLNILCQTVVTHYFFLLKPVNRRSIFYDEYCQKRRISEEKYLCVCILKQICDIDKILVEKKQAPFFAKLVRDFFFKLVLSLITNNRLSTSTIASHKIFQFAGLPFLHFETLLHLVNSYFPKSVQKIDMGCVDDIMDESEDFSLFEKVSKSFDENKGNDHGTVIMGTKRRMLSPEEIESNERIVKNNFSDLMKLISSCFSPEIVSLATSNFFYLFASDVPSKTMYEKVLCGKLIQNKFDILIGTCFDECEMFYKILDFLSPTGWMIPFYDIVLSLLFTCINNFDHVTLESKDFPQYVNQTKKVLSLLRKSKWIFVPLSLLEEIIEFIEVQHSRLVLVMIWHFLANDKPEISEIETNVWIKRRVAKPEHIRNVKRIVLENLKKIPSEILKSTWDHLRNFN